MATVRNSNIAATAADAAWRSGLAGSGAELASLRSDDKVTVASLAGGDAELTFAPATIIASGCHLR